MGKTWAALSWWHERAGPEDGELPLTLFIPARHVDTSDPESLLAAALARRTNLRTEEFWRRRLHLWLRDSGPSQAPKLLLIIDGLNQNWMFRDWSSLLQGFFANEWQGQVAVILTCRPDHWQDQLKGLPTLRPSVEPPIRIGRFNDGELDELFRLYNLRRSDFSDALLGLMRVPRLFRMAVKWRDALQESGDITRERLVYEDWKDRLSIQGEHLVGDDEFREFVARLGQRLRDDLQTAPSQELAITRQELVTELGRDGGAGKNDLITTISELVDGRWLELTGRPHRFRLHKELAPFALGLALVADLELVPSEAGLADRLAQFFDPLQGQEFGVSVLRAATTVAILNPNCTAPVRACLIEGWLTSQNFRSEDFAAFWRLIGADPSSFLNVTETFWLNRGASAHADEVLIKALVNAYKWPQVAEQLHRRAIEWLGQYWLDPDAGQFLGYDPDTKRAAANRRATAKRRRKWNAIAPQLEPPLPVRCIDQGDPSWFAHRAIGVLSFLPRLAFVPAVVAWAVSRAIMGRPRHFEEIAWLLRWNWHDAQKAEAAVLGQVDRLLALAHPMATDAARWLLEALATPEAATRAERLPARARPSWSPWPDTVHLNRTTGSVHWNHQKALEWPRSKEVPLDATMGLGPLAIDPDMVLPEASCTVLRELAVKTHAEKLWAHPDTSSDDTGLETARNPLARWAPDALCGLIRRIFASVEGRGLEGVWRLALALPTHVFILEEKQRRALVAAADAIESGEGRDSEVGRVARMYLCLSRLAERPATEQVAALAALREGPTLCYDHRFVLDAPTRDDLEAIARYLEPAAPKHQLTRWLGYLSVVPLTAMPTGFPALRNSIQHSDPDVRGLAFEVIWRSRDPVLMAAVAESGWQFTESMNRDEAAYGSLVLCEAADDKSVGAIRARIDPQALGRLALKRHDREDDLDAFTDYVCQELHDVLQGRTPRSLSRSWSNNDDALDLLVKRRGETVLKWLAPLVDERRTTQGKFWFEGFPFSGLCLALLRHRPNDGARLWLALLDAYEQSFVRDARFNMVPVEAPDDPAVDELRDRVLERTKTDLDLTNVAEAVIQHGRHDWLLRCIQRDVNGSSAAQIARGLTLAGLLDRTPAADALWEGRLAAPLAPGWLGEVYKWARGLYSKNIWAHHWLDRFITECDRDAAFGCHALFIDCADHRAFAWAPRQLNDSRLEGPWRVHWSLSAGNLRDRVKKVGEGRRKTFCGTKIFEQTQAPWL